MKIACQNMPPLRGLNLMGADFYKDVTPTALGVCDANVISKTVTQRIKSFRDSNYGELHP